MNYNKVTLVGNIVGTPVVYERQGKYIVSFVLATQSRIKDAYGDTQKESDFHDIQHTTGSRDYAYGVKEGYRALVEGELRSKKDAAGKHRWKIKAYNLQYESPRVSTF